MTLRTRGPFRGQTSKLCGHHRRGVHPWRGGQRSMSIILGGFQCGNDILLSLRCNYSWPVVLNFGLLVFFSPEFIPKVLPSRDDDTRDADELFEI